MTNRYPELVKKEDTTVPMAVELLGAVDNIEHVLGYPVTRSLALTTYSQAQDILKQLKGAGVENIKAKYKLKSLACSVYKKKSKQSIRISSKYKLIPNKLNTGS